VLWVVLGILVLAPLAAILVGAIRPDLLGAVTPSNLLPETLWSATRNSLLLGVGVAAIACTVALVLALAMDVLAPPLAALWEALLFMPFLSAPYLLGLAWSALALPNSIFSRHFGPFAGPLSHFVFSLSGIAFITATHLVPLVYTMIRGYLAGTGWRYEFAARVHGLTRSATFLRITLPRLAVPLAAGALICFLAGIDEFGIPAMLGPYMGLTVLTTLIQSNLDVWPINLAAATRTAVVLLGMGLLAWSLYRRYDRVAGLDYSRPRSTNASTSWIGVLASAGIAGWVFFTSVLPIAALTILALLRADTLGVHWDNLTLRHFAAILIPGRSGFQALSTSFNLAWSSSLSAFLIATLVAFVERSGKRIDRALDLVTTVLNALPGVVLAVALVLVWNAPWNPLPLYSHTTLLFVAYISVLLPLALRYAKTATARVEPDLLTAARVHGISSGTIATHIAFPLMLPPLIGGFSIAFAFAMREFSTSVLLQPPGTNTVSTFIFNESQQGNTGSAMAMAVVSLSLSLATVGILHSLLWWKKRRRNTTMPRESGLSELLPTDA
jgi:iron(III) transport system permease protein